MICAWLGKLQICNSNPALQTEGAKFRIHQQAEDVSCAVENVKSSVSGT